MGKAPIDLDNYISGYFQSRYGAKSDKIEEAWVIMRETAYHKRYDRQRAEDSIINAQPNLNATSASGYITAIIDYDKAEFEKILNLYLEEYDTFKDSEAYQYDLADISRQVLANSSYEYLQGAKRAFNAKDAKTFKEMSQKFLDIIKLQDKVLSTTDEFSLGAWIENSRTMLEGQDDWTKDLFEYNARAQVTSWGASAANGALKDYSNRQWSGLTGDYYYMRWSTYFEKLQSSADAGIFNANVNVNWFDLTNRWINKKGNGYATVGNDSLDLHALAKEALEKYTVTDPSLGVESEKRQNIALNKPTSTTGTAISGRETAKTVDGNSATLWVNNEAQSNNTYKNGNITIDLQTIQSVKDMELEFEKPDEQKSNPIHFSYKVEVLDEAGNWIVVDDHSNDISEKDVVVPIAYDGFAQKVRVTLPKVDGAIRPLVKPGLAEIRVFAGSEAMISKKNIARNPGVSATASAQANADRAPGKAIDGNAGTIWASGATATGKADITVDLKKAEEISGMKIQFESGKTPSFKVKVEILDSEQNVVTSYTGLEDNTGALSNSLNIPINGKGQYAKVYITKVDMASLLNPAIAEIEIYQDDDGVVEIENMGRKYGYKASAENSTNNANNLLDPNFTSRWGAGSPAFPQTITMDCGTPQTIDDIEFGFTDDLANRLTWRVDLIDSLGNVAKSYDKKDLTIEPAPSPAPAKSHIIKIKPTANLGDKFNGRAAKVVFVVTGTQTPGDGAWAGLSYLTILHNNTDLVRQNSVVTGIGTSTDDIKNVYDSNNDTVWRASGDEKAIVYDFKAITDFDKLIMKNTSQEVMPYKISVSDDNVQYKVIKDRSTTITQMNTNLEMLGSSARGRYLRIDFTNKAKPVAISEVYIYAKDLSKQLGDVFNKYQKLLKGYSVGEGSGQVLKSDYDVFADLLADAAANTADYQSSPAIEALDLKLNNANETLKDKKIYTNSMELLLTLDNARAILDYFVSNPESVVDVSALQAEYESARTAYDKYKVSQTELDTAKDNLSKQITAVEDALSAKQKYDIQLALAKEKQKTPIGDVEGNATQASMDALTAAVNKAQEDIKTASDNKAIDAISETLKTAIADFEKALVHVDVTGLQNLIESISLLNESTYSKDSWNVMQAELAKAKTLVNSSDPLSLSAVKKATEDLQGSITALVELNKAALIAEIDRAKAIDNLGYTQDSWNALTTALAEANKVVSAVSQNQTDIDKVCTNLQTAISKLEKEIKPENPVIIKDKDTKVEIDAATGVLAPETTLNVKKADEKDLSSELSKLVRKALGENSKFTAYDINLLLDGSKVQPNGSVKVTLPMPANYDLKNMKLYYINEEAVRTEVEFEFSNGNIIFEADHFSIYTIVDTRTNPVDPIDPVDPVDPILPVDPIDPVDPTQPSDPIKPEVKPDTDGSLGNTGDVTTGQTSNMGIVWMFILSGICCGALIVYRKKRIYKK